MKKLIIATDNFLPRWDGIARFLYEILPKMSEKYEITILAPDYSDLPIEFNNIKIKRFPVYKFQVGDFSPTKSSRKLIKSIKEEIAQCDYIWSQTIGPIGATAIYYGKKLQKPILSYIHSLDWELTSQAIKAPTFIKTLVRFIVKRFARYMYNKSDILLVPNSEVAKILERIKIKTPKVIIPLGINTQKFRPPESKKAIKKELGLDPDEILIGYYGRIAREKDLDTLLRAYKSLRHKYDNIKLLISGGGNKELEKQFAEHEDIIVTGQTNRGSLYLRAMDIYVLPSLTETTSLATLEAMSTGVTVVCTPVGMVPQYVKDKHNGLIFPFRNSFILRKKLEWLIESKELRVRLGENARQTVLHGFSWDETSRRIEKVFENF